MGLLNRYEKIRMDKNAILKAESRNRSGGKKRMFKVAEGLGLGVGCMEGTCGAVTGACLLAGCKNSTGNLDNPNSKASTYKLSREIMQKFKEKNSTTTCKVLKGVETGKLLRTCPDCIRDAAAIVEEVLFNEE